MSDYKRKIYLGANVNAHIKAIQIKQVFLQKGEADAE